MDSTGTLWLPPPSSTGAGDVDTLFYFILYGSVIMLAIVTGLMIFFGIRYRRRQKDTLTSSKDHSLALEITWTVIPTILIIIIFAWGFRGYMDLRVAPHDAMEVKVTGQKWFWSFSYPEGATLVNELVVPVNQPVKLLMSSKDVIHSFYVPNFRIKMDVLPNRYTTEWFQATHVGDYNLFCTEYCGKGHSEMIGKVRVLEPEHYAAWLDSNANEGQDLPPAEYGRKLYASKGCVTCHTIDGTVKEAPSFLGLFGETTLLSDGSRVTVDENYVRESILNPRAKVVNGFQPIMPTFQGVLKDRQVDALIAFLKTLGKKEKQAEQKK